MSVRPDPARHHRAADPGQRAVRGRRVRDRRRVARANRARGRAKAAGWRSASRASWSRRGCWTATSPPPRSASRWRAWAWGCTASTCSRPGSSPGSLPYDSYRWFAAHTVASVIAVSILTYFHIVLGEMVPKALALQSAQRTVLYVSPIITRHPGGAARRSCRRSTRPATACCRWSASSGRATTASATTRPRSCSSSSRRARKAGCCAANRAASSASCSSSAA